MDKRRPVRICTVYGDGRCEFTGSADCGSGGTVVDKRGGRPIMEKRAWNIKDNVLVSSVFVVARTAKRRVAVTDHAWLSCRTFYPGVR